MKRKINLQLVWIAVLAIMATTVLMSYLFYDLFEKQVQDDLKVNAEIIINSGIINSTNDIKSLKLDNEDLRVTWIDSDGSVIYDNDIGASKLGNHLDRPEVAAAFKNGSGSAVRKSDTMNQNTFYYAVVMSDGTVIRVAKQTGNVLSIFQSAIPLIAAIIAFVIAVSIAIAHFCTRSIVRPIEEMANHLNEGKIDSGYKELEPFAATIRAQHEDILKAAQMRQDFTANVSHELKTPLTAISGYSELIENGMVEPAETTRFAKEIHGNSIRLLNLINDIIELSQLDNNKENLQMENIDLFQVASSCCEILRANGQPNDITVNLSGKACYIMANKEMMVELINNLGGNAIRYNNKGGNVNIIVDTINGKPTLIVADNGIGIPKDQQERVFERFYRVDKGRSRETGGTGLGLAIVKHVVSLHDAEISLESSVGKGTSIKVVF